MFCPHCGKESDNGAKFCRHCGFAFPGNGGGAPRQNAVNACPVCGAALPAGAKFCNKCGTSLYGAPAPAAQQPPQGYPQRSAPSSRASSRASARASARETRAGKKKGASGFVRAVSLLLVAAILVTGLWKPGFMLPWIDRIGIGKPANPKVNYNTETLVIDKKEVDAITPAVFDVGTEETVATAGDITVDLGVLDGEHTLEIRDVGSRLDPAEGADVHVIDLRLDGGRTQPEAYVAVTMPYNPDNEDPYDTVTARHYDEKTKTWTVLPAEFDTDAKTITFWVNHFSEDGVFDTSDFRVAVKESLDGAIANGSVDIGPAFNEYKDIDYGPNVFTSMASVPYINNSNEAFLYNQKDIQDGMGALSRVDFNMNRLTQISKSITTDFETLKTAVQSQNNWQDDPTVAGKAAVAVGFGGNGATTTDNIQQVLSSMGKITEETSKSISKKFFIVGVVLTGIKFCVNWYDQGSFTSALKENASDIIVLALGGASLVAPPPFNVVIGVVAAGVWGATAALSAYQDSDKNHITRLRNGRYDNDTQKAYMVFTTHYISYSAKAATSGKWPGGLVYSHFPTEWDVTSNIQNSIGFYKDSRAFGSEKLDPKLSGWKWYLNSRAYRNSKDTAQLTQLLDACFTDAANVFWRLPANVRRSFAKDIEAKNYKEPDSDTIGTYREQMKQVLAMLNSKNIEYFYNQYKTKALTDAKNSIDELTKEMNTITSFSFYVMQSEDGKEKKVPLAETQYKGYIAAFCTGESSAPQNASYGTHDDWIFKTGEDKVQFQCTAYNWLKAGQRDGGSLNFVRLFKDEKALKYNESAAEASFEFANGGVEVIFGGLDDIEGDYEGTITPTGVYLGDLWYKIWGEQFGLERGDCDDAVSLNEGVRLTGVTIRKSGGLLGSLSGLLSNSSKGAGKYTLTFHVTETEDGVTKHIDAPVDADLIGGQLVIQNDKGSTSITVTQQPGQPVRLSGTGVVINFDKVSHAQMYLIIDISVTKKS